jgi:hypothetical protein
MADKKIDYNALGQAIDTTWGRSSTPLVSSNSVKMTLQGTDKLLVTYREIINFVAEKEMIKMRQGCEEDSLKIIDKHLNLVKKNYKELCGESIAFKQVDTTDTLEIIGFNVHNPKRTAYYIRRMSVEFS